MTGINELRLLTLEAIVDHCRNGMPVPVEIESYEFGALRRKLLLRFTDSADVNAWAHMLELDDRDDMAVTPRLSDVPFRVHRAQRITIAGVDLAPAWLGWTTVEAVAQLPAEQVAEAMLTDTTVVGGVR